MSSGEHISSAIRDAVAALLAGLPEIGPHVFAHRLGPLALDETPGVVIADEGEQAEAITLDGDVLRCDLELALRIYARDVDEVQRALGRHRYQVQKALAGTTLGGLASMVRYTGAAPIESEDLDPATRGVELRYVITYTVADADPDAIV